MAIGARLRGILDELIATGYPEQVAERIAKGDLDMRPEAVMERQEDLFPTTAFHGGGDDIRIVDPNRVTSGKTANTGFFMSSSPVNAASYADRAGNIMPLAVNTRGFDVVNAGYNDWNRITNPDYLLGGERLATFGELPGYRGTMEPDRGIFDLNVVHDFDTDELARTARRFGSPGLIVQNVSDVGPNYRAFDPAFEAMTGLRVGDEGYQEALDTFFTDTIVASDPTRVRSLFAAFDPEYKGSNILGGTAAGALGLTALMAPEEAEAKTPEFLASLPQLEPYEPGLVDNAVQNVADFLKGIGATESDYTANQMASSLSNLADFTPVVGDAKGFAEARDALSEGNYGEAALLGGLGLLGLIPVGGDILAGAAKGMFIGPSARNFNFEQMRRHQEMEEAGKSQREILAETGMFRGADGRVRSEISDATAKSTPFPFGQYPTLDAAPIQTTVGGILEHPELFQSYPFLQDVKVNNMAMTDPGTMHQAGGYYDPSTGELTLNPLAASSEDAARNIMLHELQHMIQQAEGFAKGGNTESAQRIAGMINRQEFQDAFHDGLEETAYKRTEILDELRALRPAETLYRMQNINRPKDLFNSNFWYQYSDDVRREIGPPPRRGQASLDYAQRAGKVISRLLQTKGDDQFMYAQAQEKLDEVGSDIKSLVRNKEAKLKRYDANPKNQEAISAVDERKRRNTLRLNETEQETYNRLGGEVESRNTEARQAMTMEERLATPYYLTQDIPNRKQEMYRLTDRGHLITYPERNRFDLLYPRGLLGE